MCRPMAAFSMWRLTWSTRPFWPWQDGCGLTIFSVIRLPVLFRSNHEVN